MYLPVFFPSCSSVCDRLPPSVSGQMPLPCLHPGSGIYKRRSTSHRHGAPRSRSAGEPAAGAGTAPRAPGSSIGALVGASGVQSSSGVCLQGQGQVLTVDGWGGRRAGGCHRLGELLQSTRPGSSPLQLVTRVGTPGPPPFPPPRAGAAASLRT